MRLAGKLALVTGAASGIGRAVVKEFLREGAVVIAADIDEAGAAAAVDGAPPSRAVRLDVTQPEEWQRVMAEAGPLNIFVSCAGISHGAPIADTTWADWRQVMAVNLDGAFLGVQSAVKAMRAAGQAGSIVLISSASGIKASPGAAAYCTSKAALRMLSKSVALECKADNIRVNTVSPAGVATPMWTKMPFWPALVAEHGSEAAAWQALGGIDPALPPLQRMALPEEVARAVVFLASDESGHMSGSDLVIDAGYTA